MINEELQKVISETCGVSFPRNIVAICNKLGITVQETNQFNDKISGLIYKENEKYYILVNAKHAPTRKAFTIAHELGHYILHREELDTETEIVSGNKSLEVNSHVLARSVIIPEKRAEYFLRENEANQFAAEILMPPKEFISKCEESNSIEEVAEYFGVSVAAASVRANKLGGWIFL